MVKTEKMVMTGPRVSRAHREYKVMMESRVSQVMMDLMAVMDPMVTMELQVSRGYREYKVSQAKMVRMDPVEELLRHHL